MAGLPQLYDEFADWFPLLSPPSDYADEAAELLKMISGRTDRAKRVLELGSGAGSLASHLTSEFEMTLTDLSAPMVEVSRRLNPRSEHVVADMRSLRLDVAPFDVVIIQDAIMYMTDAASLRAAFDTAHHHLRDGGLLVVLPDFVEETLESGDTESGGADADDGRGLRFLEWHWRLPGQDTVTDVFACVARNSDGTTRIFEDRHEIGCFPRAQWSEVMSAAGFDVERTSDSWREDVFIGRLNRNVGG